MLNNIKIISDLRNEVAALKKEVQTLKDALVKQKRDYNDLFYNLDIDNAPALNNGILTHTKEVSNSDGSKGLLITVPSTDKKSETTIEIFAGFITMSARKDGNVVSKILTGDNVAFIYAAGNAVTVDKNGVKVTTPNGEKFL